MMGEAVEAGEWDARTLSDAALHIYARLSAGESEVPAGPELSELKRYGLVRRGHLNPDTYVAVAPWDAEVDLLSSERHLVQRSLDRMAVIPAVMAKATESFAAGGLHTSVRTRIIENREEVNAQIARAFERAREEVVTAQPGSRTRMAMTAASPRDIAVLERGVAMRTLYHPSSRTNVHVQEYVRATTLLGAQVRTLSNDFPRVILVDQRDAFFAIKLPDAPEHGAVHTTDPVVVAWMRTVFDVFWPLGEAWDPAEQVPGATADNTDTKRMILQLLAEGHAQKAIAPRVGLSKSGLDRVLAELKRDFNATSLFQLGVKWRDAERAQRA